MNGGEGEKIVSHRTNLQVAEKHNSAKLIDPGFQKTISRPR